MKDLSKIGLCYHPTTTILVDDEKDFLKFISEGLFENHKLTCRPFYDPTDALDFLTKLYQADPFINHCLKSNDDHNSMISVTANLDITAIHKQMYNPKRFNQISDIVVDYAMPKMTGADVCQKIQTPYIKKIMLTGQAGPDTGIVLFNKANINQFIVKGDLNKLIPALSITIQQMQQRNFLEMSEKILNQVNQYSETPVLACLTDPAFIKLFNDICKQAQADEFYLLDSQGSFVFLDKNAKLSWLIVVSEEQMVGFHQIAQLGDSTPSIVKSLKERTKIPFFPIAASGEQTYETMNEFHPANWDKYLYPAKILEGNTRYYYAYLPELRIHDIETNKITSYQSYLDKFYEEYLSHL